MQVSRRSFLKTTAVSAALPSLRSWASLQVDGSIILTFELPKSGKKGDSCRLVIGGPKKESEWSEDDPKPVYEGIRYRQEIAIVAFTLASELVDEMAGKDEYGYSFSLAGQAVSVGLITVARDGVVMAGSGQPSKASKPKKEPL